MPLSAEHLATLDRWDREILELQYQGARLRLWLTLRTGSKLSQPRRPGGEADLRAQRTPPGRDFNLLAYDPDEPRIPRHYAGGGRWTREDGVQVAINDKRPGDPPGAVSDGIDPLTGRPRPHSVEPLADRPQPHSDEYEDLARAAAEALLDLPEFLYRSGSDAPPTKPVFVSGNNASDTGDVYEIEIRREFYGDTTLLERRFDVSVDGVRISGTADAVTKIKGKRTAIDAKYTEDWGESLRNPDSPGGDEEWSVREQNKMIDQAKKYTLAFEGGVIYHTNSRETCSSLYTDF